MTDNDQPSRLRTLRPIRTSRRLDLGRLHPLRDNDDLTGRILYSDRRRLLVVPCRRVLDAYECDIVASIDTAVVSTDPTVVTNPDTETINARMMVSADEIDSAMQSIDPVNAEMFFVVWLARAARAMWSTRTLWYKVRTLAVLARSAGTVDLNLDEEMTMRVCKVTKTTPPAISLLLKTLEVHHGLLQRLEPPENSRSLGEFRLTARDLSDLTTNSTDESQDLPAETGTRE